MYIIHGNLNHRNKRFTLFSLFALHCLSLFAFTLEMEDEWPVINFDDFPNMISGLSFEEIAAVCNGDTTTDVPTSSSSDERNND